MTDILSYIPYPVIGPKSLSAAKRVVCDNPPQIPAADLDALELYYMALGLDISADQGVDVAYVRSGKQSIGKTPQLQSQIESFYTEYKYDRIYNSLKQSFTPGFRSYFESRVGTYEPANTDKKLSQLRTILAMFGKPPAEMTAADKTKLEFYFHSLIMDAQADGSVNVSYLKRGGNSLAKKGALKAPIDKFYEEYKYDAIYLATKQAFSPAFRSYFNAQIGSYEPANTAKKIQQLRTIEAMLASALTDFCFSIVPVKDVKVPENKETVITLKSSGAPFPAKPKIVFTLDGKPSDQVKIIGEPEFSEGRRVMKVKVTAVKPPEVKPYGVEISDADRPYISDSSPEAFTVFKPGEDGGDGGSGAPLTRFEKAGVFIREKLKLTLDLHLGASTLRRPGAEGMPLEARPMIERPDGLERTPIDNRPITKRADFETELRLRPTFQSQDKRWELEARGGLRAGVSLTDHSLPDFVVGDLGVTGKVNLRQDKKVKLSPELSLNYQGGMIDYRWPNAVYASGSYHTLSAEGALSIGLPKKLTLRPFAEFRQTWFDDAAETYGHPFSGREQLGRFGVDAAWDGVGQFANNKDKAYRLIPGLNLRLAGMVGRDQTPFGAYPSWVANDLPVYGMSWQLGANWIWNKNLSGANAAVGGGVKWMEGWHTRWDLYATGGYVNNKIGRMNLTLGHEGGPNQMILNREGSRNYLALSYTPPVTAGRFSALSLTLSGEYDEVKPDPLENRQSRFYQGMLSVTGRLQDLIFGKKKQ